MKSSSSYTISNKGFMNNKNGTEYINNIYNKDIYKPPIKTNESKNELYSDLLSYHSNSSTLVNSNSNTNLNRSNSSVTNNSKTNLSTNNTNNNEVNDNTNSNNNNNSNNDSNNNTSKTDHINGKFNNYQ